MSLNSTPKSDRVHIGFFGKVNSGKSSLVNIIANQNVSIVSNERGTTTDPVQKSIEIPLVGPCILIDTAGFDDETKLGKLRLKKTLDVVDRTDIAIVIISEEDIEKELDFIKNLQEKKIKIIAVINKIDKNDFSEKIESKILERFTIPIIKLSAKEKINIEGLIKEIQKIYTNEEISITGHLVNENDLVLLVIPQDIQAPKGRLILPQVQTIRDLLENKCVVMMTTLEKLDVSLSSLSKNPDLIITDSQIFHKVYEKKPKSSKLTSFSVLFARYKGDIDIFTDGAKKIDLLKDNDSVLIAESCTHNPLDSDIAREKIPKLLEKYTGKNLNIDISSGNDFPENLEKYSLIIHCGACMFNKAHVISRINRAREKNIPITNYGIAIAYMKGILNKIEK